ncbi:MAG: hypothetical protein ACR2F5_01710, partial [Candidatus Limnocylindria bacterium]
MSTTEDRDRYRWLERLLEMVPGTISWAILILPLWLSFSYPWLVAYFVLSFDFYWLCRALWFSAAVLISFSRVKRVLATNWADRLAGLANPAARRAALESRLAGLGTDMPRGAFGFSAAARPDGSERRELQREIAQLRRVESLEEPPPSVEEITHLALIPTYTESLEKLRYTVRALAEAEWPRERKICAIITREADETGIASVKTLQAEFAADFAEFIHILDPLEPGIVVGKSSAMAWGGRYLYRLLVRERGMDPRRIIV